MLESQLLLFLSADIVGSTAYKHNNREQAGEPQPWLQFFQDFYQDFPGQVETALKNLGGEIVAPKVWKAAGDELIFNVVLGCHTEALLHVMAFKQAIHEYSLQIKKKKQPLGIKGCAWVAGFPIINAKVFPGGSDNPDYLGPLIDTGFRLSKYSSDRKFVVSVEAALLLTTAMDDHTTLQPTFYYDGREPLKGVLSDRPYPIVWIDMLNGARPVEEVLQGTVRVPATPKLLRDFCKEYIDGAYPDLVIPYIQNCPAFRTVPENHQILLSRDSDPQGLLKHPRDEPEVGTGDSVIPFADAKTKDIPAAPNA